MLLRFRNVTCCLVLLGAGLACGQNVRVAINLGGNVTITGTRNADEIRILPTVTGQIGIIGDNGTTLDVRYQGVTVTVATGTGFFLPGTSPDSPISFSLSDGNDRLYIGMDVKNISGYLGRGNDSFISDSIDVENDLIVDTGAGRDDIVMQTVTVGRNLRLNLGAGDGPNVESVRLSDCHAGGYCRLNQTSGDSKHILTNLYVQTSLRATFGTGSDVISGSINAEATYVNLGPGVDDIRQYANLYNSWIYGPLTAIGGRGTDEFFLTDTYVEGNLVMNSGADDDNIQLRSSFLAGNITLNTSSGDDYVSVTNLTPFRATSGNTNVYTGLGDDELHLGVWECRTFNAFLGGGDDTLTGGFMDQVNIFTDIGEPRVNGGAGTDRFIGINPVGGAPLDLISFETTGSSSGS